MDGRYPPYPAYKPSSVDWLGEIPSHWDARRLKFVAKIYNGATPNSSESRYWNGDIAWVTPDDLGKLEGIFIKETRRYITREGYESCGTTLVPEGSIVISTRAPIGHLAIAGMKLCTNQGCRALVPTSPVDNLYLYFCLKAAVPQLDAYGAGSTFKELSATELANFSVSFPPLPEQRAIAAYLDRETARIDALIARKRELLDLLERQRAALISHAVTKGLNPATPLKDSGIPWLGEIPGHWDVRRLKFVARFAYGDSLSAINREEGSVPVFGSNGMVGMHNRANTSAPCIVIGRKGSFGKVNYSNVPVFAIDTTFYVDQKCTKQDLRWLFYVLGLLGLDESSQDSAVPGLSRDFAYNQTVPFPDLAEQRAIAAYLDRETARIDRLKGEIEASIDLLQRYRTALISAAVTGKMDVR